MVVIGSFRNLHIERVLPAASIAVVCEISNHNRILDGSFVARRLRDALRIGELGSKKMSIGLLTSIFTKPKSEKQVLQCMQIGEHLEEENSATLESR
jgi:hypothetical protein